MRLDAIITRPPPPPPATPARRPRARRDAAQLGVERQQPLWLGGGHDHLLVQRLLAGRQRLQPPLQPRGFLAGRPLLGPRPRRPTACRCGIAPIRPACSSTACGRARWGPCPTTTGGRGPPPLRTVAAAGQVLLDPAGQVRDLPVAQQRDDRVAHALHEVPVVADDHERARPTVEQVLEAGEGVDVQVVGGLVQHQHVGLGHQEPGELQPSPLAAGELPDRGPLPRGREAEPLQHRRRGELQLAQPHVLRHRLGGLQHAHLLWRGRPAPASAPRAARCARGSRARCRAAAPRERRSRVVLPEPLTPTIPMRSPARAPGTRSSSVRPPIATVASSSSSTVRPSRLVAKPSSSTVSRGGGTSATSASAASSRNLGFDVRAAAAPSHATPCAAGSADAPGRHRPAAARSARAKT